MNAATTTPATLVQVTETFLSRQPELSRKGRDFANETSEKEPRAFRDHLHSSSVEDEHWDPAEDRELPEIVEPELSGEVDVLDDKNVWKPRLIFENRTTRMTTTVPSVIMKVSPKNVDVELFNIEAAPFQKGRSRTRLGPRWLLSVLAGLKPVSRLSVVCLREWLFAHCAMS